MSNKQAREIDNSEFEDTTGIDLICAIQKIMNIAPGQGRSPLGKLLDEMFHQGMPKEAIANIADDFTLLASEALNKTSE